jgi:large subunit ribosomal protein L11
MKITRNQANNRVFFTLKQLKIITNDKRKSKIELKHTKRKKYVSWETSFGRKLVTNSCILNAPGKNISTASIFIGCFAFVVSIAFCFGAKIAFLHSFALFSPLSFFSSFLPSPQMSARIKARIRLRVPAAKAAPSPAFGQSLGSLGVNIMGFCKEFNGRTSQYKDNIPMRVQMQAYQDNTFSFEVKSPASTWFLRQCAGIEKGRASAQDPFVGSIHVKQIYEIAKLKLAEDKSNKGNLEGFCRSLVSSARIMGLRVVKT